MNVNGLISMVTRMVLRHVVKEASMGLSTKWGSAAAQQSRWQKRDMDG